jgi:hypothetical protein
MVKKKTPELAAAMMKKNFIDGFISFPVNAISENMPLAL